MRSIGGLSASCVLAVTLLIGCANNGDDATTASTDPTDPTADVDDSQGDDPASSSGGTADTGVTATADTVRPVDEPSGSVAATTEAADLVTTTTLALPECTVELRSVTVDWPFDVSGALVPARHERDGDRYAVSGVTNEPEVVLTDTMATSFPGLEPAEPTGGASDLQLDFTGDGGEASLAMTDADGDGCWDVEIVALLTSGATSGTATPDPSDPDFGESFDDITAVGRGEIVTRRGTFQLIVARCDIGASIDISAISEAGELTIEDGPNVRWVDDEGTEIIDGNPHVAGLGPDGLTVFAEGDGPDGPESLIISISCDLPTE